MRSLMKRVLVLGGALFALAVILPHLALAQVPSAVPPFNIDMGAVITNSSQAGASGAGNSVQSAQKGNLDKSGAICTLVVTAQSGSPLVTFAIQNFDAASGQYYNVVTSGGVQASTMPSAPISIFARPGAQTSSLPSSFNAATGLSLSRFWRVNEIIQGNGDTLTGTIGCNNVK